MSTRKLLTNGNAFKRTDNRWGGVVWYMDEQGERKRKSFSGTTKAEVNKKMTEYIAAFNDSIIESQETKKRLRDSMQNWLEVFKFPSVERTTYDRYECTAKNQIYPYIGDKVVGDVKSADIKKLLNDKMNEGYAYTTVKKVHNVLNEYFRYLTQQKYIDRNPMISAPMIKKSNFLAAQDKENLPTNETITVFTLEEIKIFKDEAFSTFSNGKRKYQQVAAYILMLNTGLRTGEVLGLLNSDIDLDNRVMHLNRGVKEISKRDGVTAEKGREVKVGKLKSATSKRDVPLNDTAIEMILDLRKEFYFGEDSPLIPDEKRQLHQTCQLPQTLLQNPQSHSHRNQRLTFTPPHLRNKPRKRHKASERHNKIFNPKTSCRPSRTYYFRNYGTVLCKKRFDKAEWDNGWV